MTDEFRHTFECWGGRPGGECRMGCHCKCHPVHLDDAGFVKEPEVEGEDGPSIFDYLEAAYGVERAESLTVQLQDDLGAAASHVAQIIAAGPPATKLNPRQVYLHANEAESLIDVIELAVMGERR